ncbi:hypothetical protein L3V83_07205 [Thiotrichales bacterium 19X7-9]|nr:hypothetical protein [Thiotrichales bacterium 19X7-9]
MPFSCMSDNQPSDATVREWDRYRGELRALNGNVISTTNRHPIIYQEPQGAVNQLARNASKLECATLKNNIQESGKDNWKLTSARLIAISRLIDTYTIDFETTSEKFMGDITNRKNHGDLELAAYRLKEAYLIAIEACQIAITQNRAKRDSKAETRQEVVNGLIGRIQFSLPRLNRILENAEEATISAGSGFRNLCSLHMAMKTNIAAEYEKEYQGAAGVLVMFRHDTREDDVKFLQSFTDYAENDQQRLGALLLVYDNISSSNSTLKRIIKDTIESSFPGVEVGQDNRDNRSYKQQAIDFMRVNDDLIDIPEHMRETSLSAHR